MVAGLPSVFDAEGRLLPPVKVQACPHPFTAEHLRVEVPAGLTVAEILDIVQPDPMLRLHAHVWIGPHKIERHLWHRVRPNPGVELAIRVVPQGDGGGQNPPRQFLTVRGVALSIPAPSIAAPARGLLTTQAA